MFHYSKLLNRASRVGLVLAIVAAQILPAFLISTPASAAPLCSVDSAGANDEPGQKDLNEMCIDSATGQISWNWDETSVNGANTLDGCSLFDTDGDGNINKAICVSTTDGGSYTKTVYTCSADSRVDRCAGADAGSPATSTCSLAIDPAQTFASGSDAPNDLKATCTPTASDTGGGVLIDVCSYPSGQPNSDPSDCVMYKDNSARIEVKKVLSPSADAGLFNLKIGGTTYAANVGDGGTTGEKILTSGSITVSETPGTGTASLDAYSTTVVCRDSNGSGSIVGQASPTGATSRQITFTAADASNIVCVFTNTRQSGTLTLVKVVQNNYGGNAAPNDFGLTIDGNATSSGTAVSLNTGSHVINEASVSGYQFTSITGTNCPTALGGTATVVNDQNTVCTITNTELAPGLTVVKQVNNTNGGNNIASDFALSVNDTLLTSPIMSNSNMTATYQLANAKSNTAYQVSEAAFAGYNLASISCSDAATQNVVAHPVTLNEGQKVVCTVTNEDQPALLTLKKSVVNNYGGNNVASDWTLTATPSAGSTVSGNGDNGVVDVPVKSNMSYALSESSVAGYTQVGNWVCAGVNGTFTTPTLSSINISEGAAITCTVTNTDTRPTITLRKYVNGTYTFDTAADFTLTATPAVNAVGADEISGNGDPTTLGGVNDKGAYSNVTYTLSETGPAGYTLGTTWDCSNSTGATLSNGNQITLTEGGHADCTITNVEQAPKLIVIKHVVNDNGADGAGSSASDFTMTVTANSPSLSSFTGDESGTVVFVRPGSYSVDEVANSGYAKTLSNDCSGVIALGETKTCTITNDDIPVILPCQKTGSETVTEDSQFADYQDTRSNGHYEFVQNGLHIWTDNNTSQAKVAWYNSVAPYPLAQVGSPSIDYTINFGIKPGMQIVLDADGDGSADGIIVGEPDSYGDNWWSNHDFGVGPGLGYASYGTLVDYLEANPAAKVLAVGFSLGSGVYADGVLHSVTFGCYKWIFQQSPRLTVVKKVVNNNGGNDLAASFTMTVNATPLASPVVSDEGKTATYILNDVSAGSSYNVVEISKTSYIGSTVSCIDDGTAAVITNPVVLGGGQRVTCTITNDDKAPALSLEKVLTKQQFGGLETAADWTLTATPETGDALSGKGNLSDETVGDFDHLQAVSNVTYTLTESGPSGYLAGDTWVCDGGIFTAPNQIELNEGDDVTCQIVNSAIQPKLIVKKVVITDNGSEAVAGDFTINVSGTNVSLTSFAGSEAGTTIYLDQGSYSVSEDSAVGYETSYSPDCTGTIKLGDTKYCTVTNNDLPVIIDVTKYIVNNNLGTATVGDFDISVDGSEIEFAEIPYIGGLYFGSITADSNVTHTMSEVVTSGYTNTMFSCFVLDGEGYEPITDSNLELAGFQFAGKPGNSFYCYLENDDISRPSIKITKTGPDYGHVGDELTYSAAITNDGNAPLDITGVIDNVAGNVDLIYVSGFVSGDSNNNNVLDVGETWLGQVTHVVAETDEDPLVNTMKVCAYDITGWDEEILLRAANQLEEVMRPITFENLSGDVCGTSTHTTDILHPAIKVVKEGPASAPAGGKVTYNFSVTNTGDTTLSIESVIDDIAGVGTYVSGDTNSNAKLDAGEIWLYQAQYMVPSSQTANVNNTVVVCVRDGLQLQVCSSDKHSLTIPKVLGLQTTGHGTTAQLVCGLSIIFAVSLLLATRKIKTDR